MVRNAQKGIAKLLAQIEHQNTQRAQGIYVPQAPANNPPCVGSARYGLRPAQAEPTQL